jgi:membrane protein implicated in regulation of membrane protease activity
MGVATGFSLILIAAGAILAFAVTATVTGLDVTAVGVILMIVGIVGLLISGLFLATWGPFYRTRTVERVEQPVRREEVGPEV